MAANGNTGRPQKDIRVTITQADGQEVHHEKQVSNVNWANPSTAAYWRGGTPDAVRTDVVAGNEVCNITMIQAWDDPDSLCRFMFEHAGEEAVIAYKPHADDDFEVGAKITLMRPQIGGPVNAFNEATVACPSTEPVPVPPGA